MLRSTIINRLSLVLFSLVASSAFSGCSTFHLSEMSLFARKKEQPVLQAPSGTYTLEIYEIGKKPRRMQAPIDGPLVVQDALDRAKISRKFKRMNIELVRTASELGEPHKLRVDYDRSKKRVSYETDYAIYNKDRIKVREVSNTSFDSMIESAFSPLNFVR